MVEFALLLPLLLVLLLGIADFGRVFNAGVVIEAAARDAAEAGALERLRADDPPTSTDPDYLSYYEHIHAIAAQAACAEARVLPNTTYVPDDPSTPTVDEEACPNMPPIAVCVQDGNDPLCDPAGPNLVSSFTGSVPPECTEFTRPWQTGSDGVRSHSVEVRMCYGFTTLFNLHLSLPLGYGLNLGDVYLQRGRVFVVDCAPANPATWDPTSC